MHKGPLPYRCSPRARTGATTCVRDCQNSRVRQIAMGSSQSRGVVCRTEEPDRAASPTPDEIRSRAVLSGGHGAELETAGTLPKPEAHRSGDGNSLTHGTRAPALEHSPQVQPTCPTN